MAQETRSASTLCDDMGSWLRSSQAILEARINPDTVRREV